jgi:hypothetical protein
MSERLRRWAIPSLVLLALASSLTGVVNGFTYDDRYIVELNPAMHGAMAWWRAFATSYWPADWGGDGYRPLTILAFRLETILGGGRPMVFHVANILLYAAVAVLVYRLARQLLPAWAAWLSAALFAVHPVHVEAVANVVGQSELLVAVALLPAVILYVRDRMHGPLRTRTAVVIALLYTVACFAKEHGVVLPALLGIAELTLVQGTTLRERLRDHRLRIFYWTLAAIGLAFIAVRARVLADHGIGGFQPFTPFASLHIGTRDRVLTAIGVVPQWLRLFYWPAHLSSDYGPPDIEVAQGYGVSQIPGALLMFAVLSFAVLLRRRQPVISFAIGFSVITLLPSSNFLVPAGIVLAERTLFLPSVGAMFIVGAVAVLVVARFRDTARPRMAVLRAPAVLCAVVLALGVWKSATRTRVWRDNETLFNQAIVDSPLSYRAHYMLGAWDFEQKRQRLGEAEYKRALALFPYDPFLAFGLAEQYRTKGMCEPAVPLYEWSRALDPDCPMGRTALASCLLETGKYGEAKKVAYDAMRVGGDLALLRRLVFVADSAGGATRAHGSAPALSPAQQAGKTREVPQNTAGDDSARDAEPVRKSL